MKENGIAFRDFSCDLVDRLRWAKIRSAKSHEAARKDLLSSQLRDTTLVDSTQTGNELVVKARSCAAEVAKERN